MRAVSRVGIAAAILLVGSVALTRSNLWRSPAHSPANLATAPESPSSHTGTDVADGEPEGRVSRQLLTLASRKLNDADDVAVTVAGDLRPWARSIGSALSALTQAWPSGRRADPENSH